jgi:hypothetical protein
MANTWETGNVGKVGKREAVKLGESDPCRHVGARAQAAVKAKVQKEDD